MIRTGTKVVLSRKGKRKWPHGAVLRFVVREVLGAKASARHAIPGGADYRLTVIGGGCEWLVAADDVMRWRPWSKGRTP